MKPLPLIAALIFSAPPEASARPAHNRATRMDRAVARAEARRVEAQTGVAALKWRTRMYRAKTAANVSSVLNPLSWIFGVLW